jgi:hypothetical protein
LNLHHPVVPIAPSTDHSLDHPIEDLFLVNLDTTGEVGMLETSAPDRVVDVETGLVATV